MAAKKKTTAKKKAGRKKGSQQLTPKMAAFAQKYVELADATAAYKAAYACGKMKDETIRVKASQLKAHPLVAAEIAALQGELRERHRITVDEIVDGLARMFRLDFGDLVADSGKFKRMSEIPEPVRKCIEAYEVKRFETRDDTIEISLIKVPPRVQVAVQLMKHFGGYLADHKQRRGETGGGAPEDLTDEEIAALPDETLRAWIEAGLLGEGEA